MIKKTKDIDAYKNIYLISDSYIPQKISSAGMIYNLSKAFAERKIQVTCVFAGNIDGDVRANYCFDGINFINTNLLSSFRDKS